MSFFKKLFRPFSKVWHALTGHDQRVRARRAAAEYARSMQDMEEKRLSAERESAQEAERRLREVAEKRANRKKNFFLFSPSGGIGLDEDTSVSQLGI